MQHCCPFNSNLMTSVTCVPRLWLCRHYIRPTFLKLDLKLSIAQLRARYFEGNFFSLQLAVLVAVYHQRAF